MFKTDKVDFRYVDVVSLSNGDSKSYDSKIFYWDEKSGMNKQEFVDSFTDEELEEMINVLMERYRGVNGRFVSHFEYNFSEDDRISIIYDYLKCVMIDCLAYNLMSSFFFYTGQLDKLLDGEMD